MTLTETLRMLVGFRARCREVLAAVVVCLSLQPVPLDAARTCSITVTGLAFGSYPPVTPTPVDSTALIQVSCRGNPDPGQPGFYTIRIDGGTSGDPANRYMPSGPSQLAYNLYQDPAFTTVWGDGTAGTVPLVAPFAGMGMGMGMGMGGGMGMGNGPPFNANHTVYGRSYAGQDPAPGVYSDTPIVTIEF